MAKLIERVGKQTLVDGKPIDLGTLVNMGAEIVDIGGIRMGDKNRAREEATVKALTLATKYGCSYVMLGNEYSILIGDGGPDNYIVIASFFNGR